MLVVDPQRPLFPCPPVLFAFLDASNNQVYRSAKHDASDGLELARSRRAPAEALAKQEAHGGVYGRGGRERPLRGTAHHGSARTEESRHQVPAPSQEPDVAPTQ